MASILAPPTSELRTSVPPTLPIWMSPATMAVACLTPSRFSVKDTSRPYLANTPWSTAIQMGAKTTLGTPVAVAIFTFWPAGMLGIAAPLPPALAAGLPAGLALAAALPAALAAGFEAATLAGAGLPAGVEAAGAAAPLPHAARTSPSATGAKDVIDFIRSILRVGAFSGSPGACRRW